MSESMWVRKAKKLARQYVEVQTASRTYYAVNNGRYTVMDLAAQEKLGLSPKETVLCVKAWKDNTVEGKRYRVQLVRFYDVNEGVLQRAPMYLVDLTAPNGSWVTNIMKRTEFWKHFKKKEA